MGIKCRRQKHYECASYEKKAKVMIRNLMTYLVGKRTWTERLQYVVFKKDDDFHKVKLKNKMGIFMLHNTQTKTKKRFFLLESIE